jgi:hypothetical protein
LSCKRKLRRVSTFESTQRETEIQNVTQKVKFRGKNIGSFHRDSSRSESDDQNSPWRTHEVTRTKGFREDARWIGEDEPITLVSGINVDIDRDLF